MTQEVDWDAVYYEQVPRLYNFFRYRTGDTEIAQDLTSQTLMRAWRYRHKYNHDLGAFSAWLFQIGRNVVLDYMREKHNEPLPLYEAQNLVSALSVETEVQQRQEAQHLYRLLSQLPVREQEIIALKFGADMNNREIAQVLEMTESNVGTIVHRIIKKLRIQWETKHVGT
jgi:RNA polymerase sigma-70 factor (ECF subfamily)